jgi:hypothetical protein
LTPCDSDAPEPTTDGRPASSPAPAPTMVPAVRSADESRPPYPQKPAGTTDRRPGPVDARLVPVLVLTLAVLLGVPVLTYGRALVLPWALLRAALAVSMLVVVAARIQCSVLTAMGPAAGTLWIAAVASVQVVGDRVAVRTVGWEDAVTAGQRVRISGMATGRTVRLAGGGSDQETAVLVTSRVPRLLVGRCRC